MSRRSGYYDDAKEALVKENNGIRVWYHNYTTIGKGDIYIYMMLTCKDLIRGHTATSESTP